MIKVLCRAVIVLVMVLFWVGGRAQSDKKDTFGKRLKVEKRTVLEEYEPDMILSVKDRMDLKRKRMVEVKRKRSILDTLNISDRKRKKLLKDLFKNPFSERLLKTLADAKFEGEGN